MCGICGWIQFNSSKTSRSQSEILLNEMIDSIRHRGPDAQNQWISSDGICNLGHARLTVIDPNGGVQPMTRIHPKTKDSFTMTYNGELFNTAEIREELIQSGHSFMGYSDVEVVLHAYMEWEENCLEKFNGMFAFCIWNETRQKLFFARDRLGIKPFYYSQTNPSTFIFGSEMKTILAHPFVTRNVPFSNLSIVLVPFPVRTPGVTPFQDIKELEPGYAGTFSENNLNIWKYWDFNSEAIRSENEAATEVHRLLKDSSERYMISDVPIGGLLSGGLDSSAIVHFMYQFLESKTPGTGSQLQTFSLSLPNYTKEFQATVVRSASDESYIELFQKQYCTQNNKIFISTEEILSAIETCTIAKDLPVAGDVDTSLYILFRKIKEHVTVVLSGEGADELFGGYLHYYMFTNTHAAEAMSPGARVFDSLLRDEIRAQLNPAQVRENVYLTCIQNTPILLGETEEDTDFRKRIYGGLKLFLKFMLERKDRLSMRSGLEVRVPFLDHRLAQIAFSIGKSLKYSNGIEKYILRKSMEIEVEKNHFPEEICTRKKSPYPCTVDQRSRELSKILIQNLLNHPEDQPVFQYFDKTKIQATLDNDFESIIQKYPASFWDYPVLIPMFLVSVNFWFKHYQINVV